MFFITVFTAAVLPVKTVLSGLSKELETNFVKSR